VVYVKNVLGVVKSGPNEDDGVELPTAILSASEPILMAQNLPITEVEDTVKVLVMIVTLLNVILVEMLDSE
jgi:hypothetical protein